MNSQISIPTEHGPLYGQLLLPPSARGLVLLARAGSGPEFTDAALAVILHRVGLASLAIDLLTHQENRFPDAQHNVSLHAKRLLDCLMFAKRQALNEALASLPIGLYGSGSTSPVVVRIAALRDNDISAVVCRGGLIDQAGILYLRSLAAPLLVLVEANDEALIASTRRALQEISCRKELKPVADSGKDLATSDAFAVVAHETAQWFAQQWFV